MYNGISQGCRPRKTLDETFFVATIIMTILYELHNAFAYNIAGSCSKSRVLYLI